MTYIDEPRAESGGRHAGQRTQHQLMPLDDLLDYLREYARERPDVAAAWCFAVGFVLGWKLRPW